jgi:hypothetical protein
MIHQDLGITFLLLRCTKANNNLAENLLCDLLGELAMASFPFIEHVVQHLENWSSFVALSTNFQKLSQ